MPSTKHLLSREDAPIWLWAEKKFAIILPLIFFCTHACKENAQEKESVFELNKFDGDSLEVNEGFHLGGGLCIYKDLIYDGAKDISLELSFYIISCYGFLPIDTVAPTENVMKYKQGGLCLYYDCDINPEKSLTILMSVPDGFIDSNKYKSFHIFASKYNDSTMLYMHAKRQMWKPSKEALEYLDKLGKYLSGEIKKTPTYIPEKNIEKVKDTIIFYKKYDEFWEEFFSIAKPLKIEENATEQCNSKFCSTKDFLVPLYEIKCIYGIESKYVNCPLEDMGLPRMKIKPRCLTMLENLSEEHNILMHRGAFPAGDCDLSNWRYLKIDSLSKEHYEKLKDIVKPPNNAGS